MVHSTRLNWIETYRDLEKLRAQWDKIWCESAHRLPNTTWEWVAAWRKHLRNSEQLLIVGVRDGSTPIGLALLAASRHESIRQLELAGSRLFDYGNILAPAGYEETVVEPVAGVLSRDHSWDIIGIAQLPWEESTVTAWTAPFRERRHNVRVLPSQQTWLRALDGGWEQIVRELGPRWKDNVRVTIRRLENRGAIRRIAQTEAECITTLQTLFALHDAAEGADPRPIDLSQNPYLHFNMALVPALFKKGLVSLMSIELEGSVIAAEYSFSYANTFLGYQTAYDRRLSNLSAGKAVQIYAIQEAIREGCHHYDFGIGDEEYKQHWRVTPRSTTKIVVTAGSPATQLRVFRQRVGRAPELAQKHLRHKT